MPLSFRARLYRILLRRMFLGKRLSIAQERARVIENARLMTQIPKDVSVEHVNVQGIPAAWFRPAHAPATKTILYLHGGGYVIGSIASYQQMCAELARRLGLNLLLPEYRLAPEHPFPAALDDALEVYRWLLGQGYHAKDIVLCGDSAGGGLALATALGLRQHGSPLPGAVVCISPWTDLTCQSESHTTKADVESMLNTPTLKEWSAAYTGKDSPQNPLISPVYAEFSGFPPLLIQVGSDEILLDDSLRVAERASAAGVDVQLKIWNDLWHLWHIAALLVPESRQAMDEIGQFLQNLGIVENARH